MTKQTRTAPPVQPNPNPMSAQVRGELQRRAQRQADATLDAAAPLRYVPSMGKRLKAAEGLSDATRKAAHAALIAWNKP